MIIELKYVPAGMPDTLTVDPYNCKTGGEARVYVVIWKGKGWNRLTVCDCYCWRLAGWGHTVRRRARKGLVGLGWASTYLTKLGRQLGRRPAPDPKAT